MLPLGSSISMSNATALTLHVIWLQRLDLVAYRRS
jgi:hypothetical protein